MVSEVNKYDSPRSLYVPHYPRITNSFLIPGRPNAVWIYVRFEYQCSLATTFTKSTT